MASINPDLSTVPPAWQGADRAGAAEPYSSHGLKFILCSTTDVKGPLRAGTGPARGGALARPGGRAARRHRAARRRQRWISNAKDTSVTSTRAKKKAMAMRATRSISVSMAVM
jgi:hypothetical protein